MTVTFSIFARAAAALTLFCLLSVPALAENPYTLRLEAFRTEDPAKPILAVLTLTPAPGWHAYGNIQGLTGFPTTIAATQSGTPLTVLYPPTSTKPDPLEPSLQVELYEGSTPFFIPLNTQGELNLSVRLKALLCSSTTCQPLQEDVNLRISNPSALSSARSQSWWAVFGQSALGVTPDGDASASSENNPIISLDRTQSLSLSPRYFAPGLEVHTLSKAAVLAFLAGLVLNFMPCVLPVITLKLRSFIPMADSVPANQRRAFRAHNLFFALGMLVYFFALALIIAATGMAWGQIFQQPSAIITLTAVVFALSLSLFGIYDLPLIDLKGRAHGVIHHPKLESFITGILATILATPCSGPFLGGVLAWALIQPPQIIAVVLSCIGLGMAAPYLVMAAFPALFRYLPTPGAWTEHLERFLGFLLAGTCVYLVGLLPTSQYLNVLILLWAIALAAWIWGHWTNLNQRRTKRWLIRTTALVFVGLITMILFRPETHQDPWKAFEMRQFEADLGQKNLILDFTADWCPNCKFLEKTVLNPENSARLAKKFSAELLRVDLTRHDPELMALLNSLGSKSIPVLAIFPKNRAQSPLVLRDLFTSGQLETALESELR